MLQQKPAKLLQIPPETMKQSGCSVFDGPFLGIIFRVCDVRQDFVAGYFFGSSIFDQMFFIFCLEFDIFEIHGCQC